MKIIKQNEIFLLEEIIKRNFSSKYKDSVLGVFWTLLSPLLMMVMFTIIFSTIFKRNIENFPVYFLCGWCIFMFFTGAINVSMTALKGNKSILQRTPTPKYIFIIGGVISEFLNLIIMCIILIGTMIFTHAPFYFPEILFSIYPIISLFILVTGLGLILSIACVYYADIQHLWTVVSMMLMYGSGIFYPMEIIPEPYRQILILNPLYWSIDQFRCYIYYGTIPEITYSLNLLLISLIILIIGIITFKKYQRKVSMVF